MDLYNMEELTESRPRTAHHYREFLRVPSMSAGIYHLAAGAGDPQQPHTEDELYYVVQGRARITVGDEETAVGPGTLVFVAAAVEHRFHAITEDLAILVFFAPAEYTRRADEGHVEPSTTTT